MRYVQGSPEDFRIEGGPPLRTRRELLPPLGWLFAALVPLPARCAPGPAIGWVLLACGAVGTTAVGTRTGRRRTYGNVPIRGAFTGKGAVTGEPFLRERADTGEPYLRKRTDTWELFLRVCGSWLLIFPPTLPQTPSEGAPITHCARSPFRHRRALRLLGYTASRTPQTCPHGALLGCVEVGR